MSAKLYYANFPLLLVFLAALPISGISVIEEQVEGIVGRYQFPDGFLFGVATSAYQVEGAILEDGKGLSNWDVFVRIKGAVVNGDTGVIADDYYHRYLEDNEIIHSLGVDAYRFSISWSRILPRGKFGSVNLAGIAFYNRVIDDLLLKGIQPFVTIHHNDIPNELEDRYGGWLSPLMQDDFAHFAKTCFENFGDRVKYWVTINEPNVVSEAAYMQGQYAPGRCSPPFGNCSAGNSDIEPLIAMHNMLLGHAKAAKLYSDHFKSEQGGIIGIVIQACMYEPLTDNEHDRDATERALAFNTGWTLDPLVYGDYPQEMRRYNGNELPTFTIEERMLLKDSIDFIGINHYVTHYVKDCLYSRCNVLDLPGSKPGGNRAITGFLQTSALRNGIPIGEPTGMDGLCVVPRGIEGIVNYVKLRYNNKPMIIAENGYSSPTQQEQLDSRNDVKRVEYHKEYLAFLARAIRDGADVRGYFVWALMDNFEWSSGYSVKFGLYEIDRGTLNRMPRLSAQWYRDFLRNNTNYRDMKYGENSESEEAVKKYKETFGRKEHFFIHAVVGVLSYIAFGLVPVVTYGFAFRESDDKDYKILAVAGASLLCIIILAIMKAYTRGQHKFSAYLKTVVYYITMAVAVSGIAYAVGDLASKLMVRLGWWDSTPVNALFLQGTKSINPAFATY